jgi:type III secretion protein U
MSEKSEKPTAKKLRDAHKRGEIARSADLTTALCFAAVLGVLWFAAAPFASVMQALTELAINAPSHVRSKTPWLLLFQQALMDGARVILSALFTAFAVAVLVGAAQSRGVFSLDPLMPKLDKLNPAQGLQQMFSPQRLVELGKLLVRGVLLTVVLWFVLRDAIVPALRTMRVSTDAVASIGATAWSLAMQMCWYAAVVYLILALADVGLQIYHFTQQQRMSKDEVKRERRDQDGDPMVKSQRRRLAREIAQGTGNVPLKKANVLVTNPTHYAVALYYEAGITDLPLVIAKGTDDDALALRREAVRHTVPIIENRPLARRLHDEVDLDDYIEEAHFEAVAEVLRFVGGVEDAADASA